MKKSFDYKWLWTSIIGSPHACLFGFVIYAIPKYLIKKFLFRKDIEDFEIAKDTAISGLILGVISAVGNGGQLKYLYPEMTGEILVLTTIFAYFGIYLILFILQFVFRYICKIFKEYFVNKYNFDVKNKIKIAKSFLKKNYLYIFVPIILVLLSYFIFYKYLYLDSKKKGLLDYQIKCSQASNLILERIKSIDRENGDIKNIKIYFNPKDKKCYMYFETRKIFDHSFKNISYYVNGDLTRQKNVFNVFENKNIGGFTLKVWYDEDRREESGFFNSDTRINFSSEKEFDDYISNLFNEK